MCRPAPCRTCGKTTWTGCGAHVAQVRANVSADRWCPGHQDEKNESWLRRVLGR